MLIAVRPFGDRSIDFLLLGPRTRLSEKRNKRSIASDFGVYFAGDLPRLGAAEASRFNGRHNVAVPIKTLPNLVLVGFNDISASVWIIHSHHADVRGPQQFHAELERRKKPISLSLIKRLPVCLFGAHVDVRHPFPSGATPC